VLKQRVFQVFSEIASYGLTETLLKTRRKIRANELAAGVNSQPGISYGQSFALPSGGNFFSNQDILGQILSGQLQGSSVATTLQLMAAGAFGGNRLPGFNSGGRIAGVPGSPDKDTQVVRVTGEETIINRTASRAFQPLLDAINRSTAPGTVNNMTANFNVSGGGGSIREMIETQIAPVLEEMSDHGRFLRGRQ
jgi:hypothetical protein